MAAKKKDAPQSSGPRRPSMLEPGTGSTRTHTRFIVFYGGPGTGKTTACSYIKDAKWVVTDSNAIPTLQALGRLPPDEDIYELKNLMSVREWTQKAIKVCAEHGPEALGCSAVVYDSVTQLSDWHMEDVANATEQTFLGEKQGGAGYQKFNAEFGALIDDITSLSRYITCIVIAHAKEKPPDAAKGQWGGLNLAPTVALKLSQKANWVIRSYAKTYVVAGGTESDKFRKVRPIPDTDVCEATERAIYLVPHDSWMVKINAKTIIVDPDLEGYEPRVVPNMSELLEREGLLR